jgi:hypothetical protein
MRRLILALRVTLGIILLASASLLGVNLDLQNTETPDSKNVATFFIDTEAPDSFPGAEGRPAEVTFTVLNGDQMQIEIRVALSTRSKIVTPRDMFFLEGPGDLHGSTVHKRFDYDGDTRDLQDYGYGNYKSVSFNYKDSEIPPELTLAPLNQAILRGVDPPRGKARQQWVLAGTKLITGLPVTRSAGLGAKVVSFRWEPALSRLGTGMGKVTTMHPTSTLPKPGVIFSFCDHCGITKIVSNADTKQESYAEEQVTTDWETAANIDFVIQSSAWAALLGIAKWIFAAIALVAVADCAKNLLTNKVA